MSETPAELDEFDGTEPAVQHPGPNPYGDTALGTISTPEDDS